MSEKQSLKRQESINGLKKALLNEKNNGNITDLILLEYPKFSIYFKDDTVWHSFEFDPFTRNSLYSYIKKNLL